MTVGELKQILAAYADDLPVTRGDADWGFVFASEVHTYIVHKQETHGSECFGPGKERGCYHCDDDSEPVQVVRIE